MRMIKDPIGGENARQEKSPAKLVRAFQKQNLLLKQKAP